MKQPIVTLSLIAACLCTLPAGGRSEEAVPPKPPGGDKAPAAREKGEAKPGAEAGREGRRDPEARLKFLAEKLDLTEEQKEKIKAIYAKNAPEMKELMAKGRENASEADKEKFRELMKTQMEEVGALLTPEQKEKMKELRGAGARGERKDKAK